MTQRRRRKQNTPLNNLVNIVTAAALVIIAVLLVVFVGLYIKNNTSFGGLFPDQEETGTVAGAEESESGTEAEPVNEDYGLLTLSDGRIVYAMTKKEASAYDSEYIMKASEAEKALSGSSEETAESDDRYYLINSWLDYNYGLYHFDEYGRAEADGEYSERAFNYTFDEKGRAASIEYNPSYRESAVSGYESYPGILRTKALWVYMDESTTLGGLNALMYKKSTEANASVLGAASAKQYASPYAYEIFDKYIYYLAADGTANASTDTDNTLLAKIEGKVFRMSAGDDKRYICAEDAVGFKVVADPYGDPVVYSYDGRKLTRSTAAEEDENMVVFTEDLSYVVSIDNNKAYLELTGGQRVTMASSGFKAGNFTYSLSSDGEILSVAEKTTVNMGGYNYYVQHGTSFGTQKSRVLRRSSDGTYEVISSEFDGSTGNLHYDYDSSSMIAEYTDSSGGGGLLRISLDGDVDILEDSVTSSGSVTLYAIQNSTAVFKSTAGGGAVFSTARINAVTPLAVAVDPQVVSESQDETETAAEIAETPASAETTVAPVETAPASETQSTGTSVGSGPGAGDIGYEGVIYDVIPSGETGIGPGGN